MKTPVAAPAPPTRGDLIIYHICRFIAVGVSRLYFPGTVMGRENLPARRRLHRRARAPLLCRLAHRRPDHAPPTAPLHREGRGLEVQAHRSHPHRLRGVPGQPVRSRPRGPAAMPGGPHGRGTPRDVPRGHEEIGARHRRAQGRRGLSGPSCRGGRRSRRHRRVRKSHATGIVVPPPEAGERRDRAARARPRASPADGAGRCRRERRRHGAAGGRGSGARRRPSIRGAWKRPSNRLSTRPRPASGASACPQGRTAAERPGSGQEPVAC